MSLPPEPFAPSSDGFLVCSRKDGAGARLANLLWTWRIARRAGLRTVCFWPPMDPYYGDSQGAADVLDLFSLATTPIRDELQIIDGRPQDSIRAEVVTPGPEAPMDARAYAAGPGSGRTKATAIRVIDSGQPLLAAGEDAETVAGELRELFGRLPINRTILAGIKAVDRTHRLSSQAAVHVRRGDIVKTMRIACRDFTPAELEPGSVLDRYTSHYVRCCPPTDSYFRLIREYRARGCKVLFFSDSPDAAEPFVRRFGPEITLAHELAPPGLNGVQQAFFEMLLMSRCRVVIGAKSLFSRMATMVGKPRFIDARRHATPEEFVTAFKQAVRFATLPAPVQEAVGEMLLRRIEVAGFGEVWNADEGEILRLFRAA